MRPPERVPPATHVLTRPAPPPDLVIRYGPGEEQIADVRLPPGHAPVPAPLVVFLHGGFWRVAYDRAHAGPFAAALAAAGYVVCVPEFRRTGQPGGGWPGTFDDVAAAVDRLPGQVLQGPGCGARSAGVGDAGAEAEGVQAGAGPGGSRAVLVAGHSAGGHLALWAAGRNLLPAGSPWHAGPGRIDGVVALAAVSDLVGCHRQGLGEDAADALMGGGPGEFPQRYRDADPGRLLPLPCPVRLVHGSADDRVPSVMSRDYVARAHGAGADVSLEEVPGGGHFDVIDPLSLAWPRVLDAFRELAPAGSRPAE